MVSEEDTLKKLYKNNNPPISHLCVRTPKKVVLKFYFREQISKAVFNSFFLVKYIVILFSIQTPSSLTTPGSTLKFGAMRKMREDRWAVIAKMDRKQKLKEAEKLFV